nr:MAG TPA: hypothetical protein [Caudoviricetes sp.]
MPPNLPAAQIFLFIFVFPLDFILTLVYNNRQKGRDNALDVSTASA